MLCGMGEGMNLRTLLGEARRARGVTQVQLMNAIGLKQPASISRWENGASIPDPRVLERIIVALDLDPDEVWPLWGYAYAERTRAAMELGEG